MQFLPESEKVTLENPAASAPGADAFRWFFLRRESPLVVDAAFVGECAHAPEGFSAQAAQCLCVLHHLRQHRWLRSADDEGPPGGGTFSARPLGSCPELAILAEKVPRHMDAFHAYEAAGALAGFVDGLSNWYLRRSRRRYWKSEFDDDKQDAYATLYEALVTVIHLAAPFVPFMTEEMYQNLVRRPLRRPDGGEYPPPRLSEGEDPEDRPRVVGRNGRRARYRLAGAARPNRTSPQGSSAARARRDRPARRQLAPARRALRPA